MPGSYIFKPLEANLTHKTNLFHKMDPYCSFRVGRRRIKGPICENGGKHPQWHDSITIPVTMEEKVLVELRNKDRVLHHNSIGSCIVDLCEIENQGSTTKWYVLYYKNKKAGEILIEATFQPDGVADNSTTNVCDKTIYGLDNSKGESLGTLYQQEKLSSEISRDQEYIFTQQKVEEKLKNPNIFIEQRQIMEPHTFFGEVEVVETRPVLKEVEVMKPIKVMKDVEFTQVIPVKKQLQVSKPYVVVKEVEVMEPQLVNKTIQVVENVTVKKMIEVIEMRKVVKEIETVEPQTFTKQVEVTELLPEKKKVEVTQPITLKKAVEFVEPVITTKTITKEAYEPVVVSEKMTTSVGPASLVGMNERYREDFYVKEVVGDTKFVKDEKIQWSK